MYSFIMSLTHPNQIILMISFPKLHKNWVYWITVDFSMQCTENPSYVFPEMKRSQFLHIHVSVIDLYISTIGLPISLQKNRQTDPGNM